VHARICLNMRKIIVKFPCFVIVLLAFGFLSQVPIAQASAPTYFGSASNPADNGTGADGSTLAVTPPASMNAGDLVVMIGQLQDATTGNITISATGGQTWSSVSEAAANDMEAAVFWTQYNGTWSTDPSLAFAAITGTQPATAVMHVFRPASVGSGNWVLDTAFAGGAEASASPVVISGITPTKRDNVTLAGWAIPNVSTWGTLSGTGWVAMDTAQWRNTSGSDQSATFAHQLQSAPAATNDVSQAPSTAVAGVSFTMVWSFQFSPTVALNSPADASSDSDTTPTLNFTGTDANSDTVEYNVQVDTQNDFNSGGDGPLLNKVSTIDAGFTAGYPFASGVAKEYTVGNYSSGAGVNTYYFDGSDVVATDPDSVWTDDNNTFDSDATPSTYAYTSMLGSPSGNFLKAEGTNAPATPASITQVRARFYGEMDNLGGSWGGYTVLSAPGGWSRNSIAALESYTYKYQPGGPCCFAGIKTGIYSDGGVASGTLLGTPTVNPVADATVVKVYKIEIEATASEVADDTLTASTTYYWRVRAIDPSGTNTYGAWSSTRSFTVTGGGGSSPARTMRLFEGFRIVINSGTVIIQ